MQSRSHRRTSHWTRYVSCLGRRTWDSVHKSRTITQELVTHSSVFANWVRAARIDRVRRKGVAAAQTELFIIHGAWTLILPTGNSRCRFHKIQTRLHCHHPSTSTQGWSQFYVLQQGAKAGHGVVALLCKWVSTSIVCQIEDSRPRSCVDSADWPDYDGECCQQHWKSGHISNLKRVVLYERAWMVIVEQLL